MESMLVIILMEKFFLRENLKMENSTEFGQEYHEDGSVYWNLRYINGITEDGMFRMYYPDGSVESEVTYGNGKPITNWVYFDKNGNKERVKVYENGTFIYEKYVQ